jgi:lauroyl/myristoyl acyltransferase
MRKIREAEIRRKESAYPNFKTLYNLDDNLLGIELFRLLAEGNIVAVQGDRVMFDVSPMDVEIRPGLHMRLPKGPLFLARATGAACYPLFVTRDGWHRYRVTVHAPLQLRGRKRGGDDDAAKLWATAVFETVSAHWNQWFVFENVLNRPHRDCSLCSSAELG